MDEAAYWDLITVPRRAWDPTEQPHPRHGERTLDDITRVEVHWPAAFDLDDHGDSDEELLAFERFHEVTKGWADLFYNIAADTEGDIYEGRDITVRSQANLGDVMTMLVLHGIDDDLTTKERDVFGFSIWKAWGAVSDGIRPNLTLGYHSERSSTQCPGDHLRSIITDLWDGWIPPQANGRPPSMFIQTDHADQTQASYFRVVRPQGVATPGNREHWSQVVKAGQASGVYVSAFWDDLDGITTPHQTANSGDVMTLELSDKEIKRIADGVLDMQAKRLEH